jgi:hypothetical protein
MTDMCAVALTLKNNGCAGTSFVPRKTCDCFDPIWPEGVGGNGREIINRNGLINETLMHGIVIISEKNVQGSGGTIGGKYFFTGEFMRTGLTTNNEFRIRVRYF